MFKIAKSTLVLSVITGAIPGAAFAQNLPSSRAVSPMAQSMVGPIPEIIVTAQKRSEDLQKVPIAVSAITSAEIEAMGLHETRDLAIVTSGLNIPSTVGYIQPNLRGIGSSVAAPGVDSPVALYIDGVYITSETASLLTFNNIAQVEVLKGPQGTLFGRNATGGLIQVTTLDPSDEFGGHASVSYGNYNTFNSKFYLTGGLAPNLAANIAVQYSKQGDGWGHNQFDGSATNKVFYDWGVRSKIRYSGASTDITLNGDYSERKDNQSPFSRLYKNFKPLLGAPFNGGPYDTDLDYPALSTFQGGGGSVRASQNVGALQVVSISAFRSYRGNLELDADGTPVPAVAVSYERTRDQHFTQELQLLSPTGGKIQYVVGAFYLTGFSEFTPNVLSYFGPFVSPAFPLVQTSAFAREHTESISGFGQGTLLIGDASHFTLGIRYTSETRRINAAETGTLAGGISTGVLSSISNASLSAHRPTWRASVDHSFTPDILGYVSYNRGFKSGGFNTDTPTDPPYAPEKIDAYETGIKSTFLDDRLRLNSAAFFYDYKNIQVVRYVVGATRIVNGAAAHLYGLDLDAVVAPTESLRVTGALSLLHARFTSFPGATMSVLSPFGGNIQSATDAKGHQIPYAPSVTFSLGANYTIPVSSGNIQLDATYYFNGGFYTEPDNFLHQGSYNILNASITWNLPTTWNLPGDGVYIRAWGRNLTGALYATLLSSTPLDTSVSYGAPRTYGIEVGAKF